MHMYVDHLNIRGKWYNRELLWRCGSINWYNLFWKLALLTKVEDMHFCDSAFSHLAIYPTEVCPYVHQKIRTRIFIETLFVIAPNGKLLKCPSIVDLTNVYSIHTLEHYTATRTKNLQQQITIWMTHIKYRTDKTYLDFRSWDSDYHCCD